MNGSSTMTILSFIYSLILIIVYFNKPHIKSYENKMFSSLIIINLLSIIIEIINILIISSGFADTLICQIANKSLLIFMSTFICYYSLYILIVSYNKDSSTIPTYYNKIKGAVMK